MGQMAIRPMRREVREGISPDSGRPAYLLERIDPREALPNHPALPVVEGTTELDGRTYWVINPPSGISLLDVLHQQGAVPETSLARVRTLSEGVMHLEGLGLLPEHFYSHIVWNGEALVIDYPAALHCRGCPSFPAVIGVAGATGAVITLAAVLHGCFTGKVATDPPYLFAPVRQFCDHAGQSLQSLISDGLAGNLPLASWLNRLSELEVESRLAVVFPSPLAGVASQQQDKGVTAKAAGVNGKTLDLFLWAVCFVLGLIVLIRWDP